MFADLLSCRLSMPIRVRLEAPHGLNAGWPGADTLNESASPIDL
jgi:hypothetical protein